MDSTQVVLVLLLYICEKHDEMDVGHDDHDCWTERTEMTMIAAFLFALLLVLLGGTLVSYALATPSNRARIEEIRRLRQEGLAGYQHEKG